MIKSLHFKRQYVDEFLDRIWGIYKLYINSNFKKATDSQIAAIVLCVNPSNFDRLIALNSFKTIFSNLNLELNKYSVQLMQIGILNAIVNLEIKKDEIQKNLEILAKNEIIDFTQFKFINEFLLNLTLLVKEEQIQISHDLTFHKNIATLNLIYEELKNFNYKDLENRLNLAYQSANNSKFFIAVTGVINAGKSSTLNALIGKKVLGVSNIPETANLSVITYSENEFARVNFWDKNELSKMGLEIKELQSIKIAPNELKNYTTATNPISPYVKEVILGIDLDILKDGINIVDTPGLDDAIVLREELTKRYMQESDFTLHLMNASQSATKKDMSFICNTLKNGKSGGLIVVLTHIDKLNLDDLNEVLKYTKKSIEIELNEYDFNKDLADEVNFFSVSAISGDGIKELKNYLYKSFFGQDSKKAGLIIDNYKKELLHICKLIKDETNYALRIMGLDAVNLEAKSLELELEIKNLNTNLADTKTQMDNIILALDYSKLNELSDLKSIASRINDRIVSDVKYAKTKKTKLNFERIGVICESGFCDAFIDFFREFKQKISKDIDSLANTMSLKLGIKNEELKLLDIKEYIDANLPKINYEGLKLSLISLIKNESSIESLSHKITRLFDEFLLDLELPKELKNLATACTKDFIENVQIQINLIHNMLKIKENDLKNALNLASGDIQIKQNNKKDLEIKQENLENIYNRINVC